MQNLMGMHNAICSNSSRFASYSDLNALYERISELSRIVSKTYAEIGELAGERAVKTAKHSVSQISQQKAGKKHDIDDAYFRFVDTNNLALSLFFAPEGYGTVKFVSLSFERVTDDWQTSTVPEIFAMLNVMKSGTG
mgnify:CR=1 FL=1